jgi:hypothetical protein
LKLESAFCDLHPTVRLAQSEIRLSMQPGVLEQKALHCTRPKCNRHFHYDYGYFPFIAGQDPEFGNLDSKPRCRLKHDLLYMLLTRIDDRLVYACFFPECTTTIPFNENNGE